MRCSPSPDTSCNMRSRSRRTRRCVTRRHSERFTRRSASGCHTAGGSTPRQHSWRAGESETNSIEASEDLRRDEPSQGTGPFRWKDLEVDSADRTLLELDCRACTDQARGQFTKVRLMANECDPRPSHVFPEFLEHSAWRAGRRKRVG